MLAIRSYMYPQCEKRMKSRSGLKKHLNACKSLLLLSQLNWDSPILAKDDDTLDYFIYDNEKEYALGKKRQDIKEDQRNLVGKSWDNKSVRNMLPKRPPQDGLHASELLSSLKEVWFSEQKFLAGTPVSNIKYNYLGSQNNNIFYPFNN